MTTLSLQEYRKLAKKKRNKYGAVKTTVDGIRFDSKREARRYEELKYLEKSGVISHIELQPTYPIVLNKTPICKVKLDFRYWEQDEQKTIIEDAKGRDNPLSKLKRRLVEAQYGIKVELV